MMTLWGVLLLVNGLVFGLWAFASFSLLFRIRRHAVAGTDQVFPGAGQQIRAFRTSWRAPEDAGRWRLWMATLFALVVLTALQAVLGAR